MSLSSLLSMDVLPTELPGLGFILHPPKTNPGLFHAARGIGCLVLDYPATSAFISFFPLALLNKHIVPWPSQPAHWPMDASLLDVHWRSLLPRMLLDAIVVEPLATFPDGKREEGRGVCLWT